MSSAQSLQTLASHVILILMPAPPHSMAITDVIEWQDGQVRRTQDYLAAEEPLEIRINGVPTTVTMRTPGHDLELAAGFLWTEGLVDDPRQIEELRCIRDDATGTANVVEAAVANGGADRETMQRNFFAASSCGICGKASIEAIRRRGLAAPNPGFQVGAEALTGLADKMRSDQAVFGRTGGLHAAGLFSATGELIVLREDIGRHNAVDKIAGWAIRNRQIPLGEHILMVSGRGGFEIVQKAIAAGIPLLASVSAPSSLAVKLARQLGLSLIGFLRGRRFVIYSGAERIIGLSSGSDHEPS